MTQGNQPAILALLAAAPDGLSISEIAQATGRSTEDTKQSLLKMKKQGKVHAVTYPGWALYFDTPERRDAAMPDAATRMAQERAKRNSRPGPRPGRRKPEKPKPESRAGNVAKAANPVPSRAGTWRKLGDADRPPPNLLQHAHKSGKGPVQIHYPAGIKVQVCPPCDVERFKVDGPVPGGFRDEFKRLCGSAE